jgi:hypothetical protein
LAILFQSPGFVRAHGVLRAREGAHGVDGGRSSRLGGSGLPPLR